MTVYPHEFAPGTPFFTPAEEVYRRQLCLNGSWAFQPVDVPSDYIRNTGEPPALPPPEEGGWSGVPIRIPSPWNGNTWGSGRIERDKLDPTDPRRYFPDSVYYPSYPEAWDHAEMGWLRKRFTVPESWTGLRVFLRFEAVMGQAQVLVNGRPAGENFDGYLPFELDITGLIKPGKNELLTGVRRLHLFDKQSAKYKHMRTTYPHGSNTQGLGGIWQDVWLLARPAVYIGDVFVKPLVDRDLLEAEVQAVNTTAQPQTVTITAGAGEVGFPPQKILVAAGQSITITIHEKVKGRLPLWSPAHPRLCSLEVELSTGDRSVTRFGWRQFTLEGKNLLLNGEVIRLVGDICHPFGPYMFSRRWIESWFRLIQSVGGNAVRLHAQPHPRIFLDVADEMGICVLDETALFGSCLSLNFEDETAWKRYQEHVDGLVLRDRNHPAVFGWSFGNELFAIFLYDEAAKEIEDESYARLFGLGNRIRRLDGTRDFITCDGDEDLWGTLPVWSKHCGHGLPGLPEGIDKPMAVGENGGTYYARPEQLAVFNGDGAYASYEGRNRALGIDLYANIRYLEGKLAYFSPSELVWFGLRHLPYGYNDFSRLPGLTDGVFFSYFMEGRPGMYLERLPPYSGTLNPGFDPVLPEYIPLDMYCGMKDALRYDDAFNEKWRRVETPRNAAPQGKTVTGLITAEMAAENAKAVLEEVTGKGGTVLVIAENAQKVNAFLPKKCVFTDRIATKLDICAPHIWGDSLTAAELYFAEEKNPYVMRHGIAGELAEEGEILLAASDTNWALFNNIPETAKCGATVMFEQMEKEPGAALVRLPYKTGQIAVCSVPMIPETALFYHRLMENMGFPAAEFEAAERETGEHNLLLNGPDSAPAAQAQIEN